MKSLVLLISILSLFTGCQESVFQSLKKTDELFVYEGLPHPLREFASFEKERKRNDVTQIDGHWFYDAKVKANGNTRDQMMNLLFDESGFSVPDPKVPPKDCGPFHPDYAIAWKSKGEENYLMICYTCGEAKLIREGKATTYEVYSNWQEVLSEFQSKRPPKQ
jgi:hypothetical protein